ncbi:hypothetical protein Goari_020459, partial [Gossypium aridum]|nr:hypothetical protein [Gossypium aridum]
NLRYRGVVVDATCPRCRRADENTDHVFRVCPISVETWINLKLSWILLNTTLSNWEWITWVFQVEWINWVFQVGSSEQCRLFCCGLWAILTGPNQLVHERKIASGKDIADWVIKYKGELDGLETRKLTRSGGLDLWKRPSETNIKITFDGAFDLQQKKSGSGVMARNSSGKILASKSGDSLTVIKKCKATTPDKSEIGALIRDIQQHKGYFQHLFFQYILKLANSLAHNLATESLKKGEEVYLHGESFLKKEIGSRRVIMFLKTAIGRQLD